MALTALVVGVDPSLPTKFRLTNETAAKSVFSATTTCWVAEAPDVAYNPVLCANDWFWQLRDVSLETASLGTN